MLHKISVSQDFTVDPYGRYENEDGKFSGETFREKVLKIALQKHDLVQVDLDGTEGYGSSFLEEAFGGLVREGYFSEADLKEKLNVITSEDETWVTDIWQYINDGEKMRLSKK